jgi:hypothetical protein
MASEVTTKKLACGNYLLTREDGYTTELTRVTTGWWESKTSKIHDTLHTAKYDVMTRGGK